MQTRDIYKKLCVLFGAKDGNILEKPPPPATIRLKDV